MNEHDRCLKERLPHGNLMFPLMVHEMHTDPQARERLYCHWHEEAEFLVVTRGSVTMHVDEQCFSLAAGDGLLVPSGSLHSAESEEGEAFDFFAVVFSRALIDSRVNDRIQQRYIDRVPQGQPVELHAAEGWQAEALSLLHHIREAFSKKPAAYELRIKIALYQLWLMLYENAAKPRPERDADERVHTAKAMLAYIAEHSDRPIPISELAAQFYMSEGHLCRFFKAMTKMSVVEYLHYYRISQSVELLRDSGRDVSDIALQVGFHNISYFNKVFKRYMHLTPTEYRREVAGE